MFDLELQETHENGSVMSWDGADRDSGFEREPLNMASRIHRGEQVPGPFASPWSAREAFGLNEILSLDVLGGKIPSIQHWSGGATSPRNPYGFPVFRALRDAGPHPPGGLLLGQNQLARPGQPEAIDLVSVANQDFRVSGKDIFRADNSHLDVRIFFPGKAFR